MQTIITATTQLCWATVMAIWRLKITIIMEVDSFIYIDYPQNYMSGYNQNQNYMIQNMLRTGQGLPPGYQHLNINGYGTQNGQNNNNSTSSSTNGSTNGQYRRQ